jgi:signal transduction histidine kinase
MIHPESRQEVAARYKRRIAGEDVPGIYQASLLTGDGQKLTVELHAGTVEYEGGPAVLVVVRDVSARLRAEQELREQRELLFQFLETVPAGVFVIDAASGNPFYSNRAAKQILGKGIDPGARPDDLAEVYQAVMAGSTEPYPTDRMPVVRALRGESSFVDDMVIRRPGGAIPLHVSASPIYNSEGRIAYATAAFMDVSERVKVEEKLRRALQELERSNQELEQFAYVASHDLQEPLRMVISFMQLLAKRYQGQLDERADEYIGYAVQGGQRMKDLISDLLALSRVGTRGRELSPTSCDEALDEALQNLKLALEECGAEVTRDPLPEVLADPRQLVQLLQNLIDNAIKFRQQEAPRVHVFATREQGSWRVAVQDNGIGIEPRFAERIFVVFQRLHGMDQYSGSGIGLAICKKIIERHGGRIWFESEPGQGSTFYFTLQAAE